MNKTQSCMTQLFTRRLHFKFRPPFTPEIHQSAVFRHTKIPIMEQFTISFFALLKENKNNNTYVPLDDDREKKSSFTRYCNDDLRLETKWSVLRLEWPRKKNLHSFSRNIPKCKRKVKDLLFPLSTTIPLCVTRAVKIYRDDNLFSSLFFQKIR